MSSYFYTLEILRDGRPVGRPVGLEAPMQLGVEALRWRCACLGTSTFDPRRVEVSPVWREDGAPAVAAIEFATADHKEAVALDVRPLYSDEARKTSSRLVQEKELNEGDRYDYRIQARERGAGGPLIPDLLHYEVEEDGERPPTGPPVDPDRCDPNDCSEVVIDPTVLSEASRMSRAAGENETGGLLGGHLRRGSGDSRVLFLHVTVVVPAEDGHGERASFKFSASTWNRGRAALDARGMGEIMCGWFHSHPPDLCSTECPPEKRETCPLRHPFLSPDDLLVHEAAFPGPFNIALLVSDQGGERHVPSVWGWRNGVIARRSYHITKKSS